MIVRNICLICGYDGLSKPAWIDDSPSFEICPSCGTEFGYDDWVRVGERRAVRQGELREAWKAAGCPWWSQNRPPPAGWDSGKQLKRIEE